MKDNTALILIDMINKMDFEGGEDLLENTKPIVDSIINLKRQAKESGLPVIYVNDNFGLWQESVENVIEVCRNERGREVVEQVLPDKDDFFIIKPKHSGFYSTQLDILLSHLGVKNLILTGIAGDICVLFTADDAYMREYNLWVPSDCTASETEKNNDNALRLMKRSMFANIQPTSETNIENAFQQTKQ
ncbi:MULTISPECIES: isochorismatase family cysteine hydrolase [Allobacillus]|uniref:Cysteine hydrolase n=1 Tax=Allobacillus salarius TaxID=1955272 RepID=A0A556PL03_9BACI|nr:isochorismatase family cysteine hydrolase [Allobacillus salarius]TSJ65071.1 cysteine hydrolase [Allobacillus salarius]